MHFSTYTYPPYSTSDLRQIRYTIHPTYSHVELQLLYGLVAAAPGPLACQIAAVLAPLVTVLAAALGPESVLT